MKNTNLGKTICMILSVLLCVLVLAMFGLCSAPYYTISEPYHYILNPNPMPSHYSLMDVMWMQTNVITTYFTDMYSNFEINDYVTNMVLSFIFGLGVIVTSIWHTANEFRRYPSMTSGIFVAICSILWGVFSLLAYPMNVMLDMGVDKFEAATRPFLIIISIVGTVLALIRFVFWLLTEIQVSKQRKARLALL